VLRREAEALILPNVQAFLKGSYQPQDNDERVVLLDADKLSEEERKHWRKQARDWLQADLAMWTAIITSDSPLERNLVARMLRNWQTDPELAGIREPHALDDLSALERNDFLAIWDEVRATLTRGTQHRGIATLDPKRSSAQGPSPTILMRLGRVN
jgi:hypothetical protein